MSCATCRCCAYLSGGHVCQVEFPTPQVSNFVLPSVFQSFEPLLVPGCVIRVRCDVGNSASAVQVEWLERKLEALADELFDLSPHHFPMHLIPVWLPRLFPLSGCASLIPFVASRRPSLSHRWIAPYLAAWINTSLALVRAVLALSFPWPLNSSSSTSPPFVSLVAAMVGVAVSCGCRVHLYNGVGAMFFFF